MSDCIFCKIASGEIPGKALYEDDDFKVILDLGPASKGHALILPKAHYANVYEMPDELLGKAFSTAKMVAKRMVKALGCDGVNILQNNGEAAGQTVFHFHIHVIPRYNDGDVIVGWKPGTLTDEAREEIFAAWEAAE